MRSSWSGAATPIIRLCTKADIGACNQEFKRVTGSPTSGPRLGNGSGLNRDPYFLFMVEVMDWMTVEAILKASPRSLM
jgi:hypothetical protein